ncbi:MAG: DNA-3-methyladenine glycosylase 2 family protein [Clostridia bacterium]|nr:DNA-3-methyladenine glycosylase 2 family protein [Clostridia bacterium]
MKYEIKDDRIVVYGREDFSAQHILECGQVFRYRKDADGNYIVYSCEKSAKIVENGNNIEIISKTPQYFADYFDMGRDYSVIKNELKKDGVLAKVLPFGSGIRILRQDIFEVIVSFVISANNNIKRIQKIIEQLCVVAGKNMGNYHAFPTRKDFAKLNEAVFYSLGAGYRAGYLFKLSRQLENVDFEAISKMDTNELRNWLIKLSGVGPKVADCILLFGFNRGDVFPVDTWSEKVYRKFYDCGAKTRPQMAKDLVERFGCNAGFAQQYLFYGARSYDILR